MKKYGWIFLPLFLMISCTGSKYAQGGEKWISLFNGTSLDGWKVGENAQTFSVDSGRIRVNGNRAHLFYDGPVSNHDFVNFHFKTDVMTTPGSNSGIYFHTKYQEKGWPAIGFEVQVNNSHTDWRRTGSLYAINDVRDTYVKDNEWYTEEIIVVGKAITVKINGKTVMEYTEPAVVPDSSVQGKRRIGSGTFALQGHDPKSKVYYRNIQVRNLPVP